MSRWKKDDASESAIYMREWIKTETGQEYREKANERSKKWKEENKEQFHKKQKEAYAAVRLEILRHYSNAEIPFCRCCGEKGLPFLHIDHKRGDGAAHRREIGMQQGAVTDNNGVKRQDNVKIGGNGFCYWLKKNGFPEGFQVLCASCNLGKDDNKYCPHELEKGMDMDGNLIPKDYVEPKKRYRSRPNKQIEVSCNFCGQKIMRKKCFVTEGAIFYCNKECTDLGKMGKSTSKNTDTEVFCSQCQKSLLRTKAEIRNNQTGSFYCSQECKGLYRSGRLPDGSLKQKIDMDVLVNGKIELTCFVCNIQFLRIPSEVRKNTTGIFFCGKPCLTKHRESKKQNGQILDN